MGVEAGEGPLRPPGRRAEEARTAEKVDVSGDDVEIPGPGLLDCGGRRRGGMVGEGETLLFTSGVNRRRPD
jgi:hypothetical protein